jgi:hypothetical protein
MQHDNMPCVLMVAGGTSMRIRGATRAGCVVDPLPPRAVPTSRSAIEDER